MKHKNALTGYSSKPYNNITGYTHMAFHQLANKHTAHQMSSTTMIHSIQKNIQAIANSAYSHVRHLMNIH